MFENDIDLSNLTVPDDDKLKQLSTHVASLVAYQEEEQRLEDDLKAIKDNIRHLKDQRIPELMAEAGVLEFKTLDGKKVSVKDVVSCGLPKDPEQRANALDWLKNNDAEALIQNEVTVTFGRGQDPEAQQLVQTLVGLGLEPCNEKNVNFQTLSAWARDQIRKGNTIPDGVFNLFVGRSTVIK